jgi:hypothetical protein
MERLKNEHIKEIMGVKGKPDIIDKERLQWYGNVKRMPEEKISKLILEWVPEEGRKSGRLRKTSSHDSEKFRTRSMEKRFDSKKGLLMTS